MTCSFTTKHETREITCIFICLRYDLAFDLRVDALSLSCHGSHMVSLQALESFVGRQSKFTCVCKIKPEALVPVATGKYKSVVCCCGKVGVANFQPLIEVVT